MNKTLIATSFAVAFGISAIVNCIAVYALDKVNEVSRLEEQVTIVAAATAEVYGAANSHFVSDLLDDEWLANNRIRSDAFLRSRVRELLDKEVR